MPSWISIHIFYYGNQNDLIVRCLAPLAEDLRAQKLIQRSFFIKYWMEGSHVRLRLLPATTADEEKIRQIAEQTIAAYLARRPALFKPDHKNLAPFYKTLFIGEYGEEKWLEQYGENGSMSLRPNNSFASIEYEPEYLRYGGPEGVELAEWHFDYSSKIVIDLLRKVNIRVPSILLGISFQLSLPYFFAFFDNDQEVISALDGYIKFWQRNEGGGTWAALGGVDVDSYDKYYQRRASDMQQRALEIKEYMTHARTKEELTPIEYLWKSHIQELRQRVDRLMAEGKLTFPGMPKERWVGQPDTLHRHLLVASYVHMTNNRLGVMIPQEVYLTYLSKRALEDLPLHVQEVAV